MSDELDNYVTSFPDLYHSEQYKEIYTALIQAQKEFTAVPKTKEATVRSKSGASFTYKYADLADVMNMALPILSKHDLGIMQPYILLGDRLRLCTRLIHSSGQWLQSHGLAIAEMVTRQEFGGDSTYDRRYDVCSLLGIVADEDIDARSNPAHEVVNVRTLPVRQPTAFIPHSTEPQNKPLSEAEKILERRNTTVEKLKQLVPNAHELGQRARVMFPEHRSTKTLTVADLEHLLDEIKKGTGAVPEKPVNSGPLQPIANERLVDLFEDGTVTTGNRIPSPVIGTALAQRLHKLMGIAKLHTEQELQEDYLQPYGVQHVSELPRDLYQSLSEWAEGKLVEGTSIGDATEFPSAEDERGI